MLNNNNKIAPDVRALISPIVYNMTKINIAQTQQKRMYNKINESEEIQLQKRRCVHILYDGSGFSIAATRQDGKLVCKCCGREIGTDFSDEAVNKIAAAIPVINQLVLFGMLKGLDAQPLNNMILLKTLLPDAAKLMKNLNDFVSRDNAAVSVQDNVGAEYQADLFNMGITNLR